MLIPNTVNGKPFTMNCLKELIQKPKSGHSTKYIYYHSSSKEVLEDKSYPSHWVLMTRDIIPGIKWESYSKCCELVASHSKRTGLPYELPHLLEAAASIFMHYVKTGERLYRNDPWTFTYSHQDVYKSNKLLVAGGFSPSGLRVYNYCILSRICHLGVAVCRKF